MSMKSQPKPGHASSRNLKPASENVISFPAQANVDLSQPQGAANNTSTLSIPPPQAIPVAHNKKPVQVRTQNAKLIRKDSAVALFQGEMQAIMENGKMFRQKQAEKLGLSPKEIQRRESLEESVTRIRIPETIDTRRLQETLDTIHKTCKALIRWKKSHPGDPLIEELQSLLSSQEATIKLLLDTWDLSPGSPEENCRRFQKEAEA